MYILSNGSETPIITYTGSLFLDFRTRFHVNCVYFFELESRCFCFLFYNYEYLHPAPEFLFFF